MLELVALAMLAAADTNQSSQGQTSLSGSLDSVSRITHRYGAFPRLRRVLLMRLRKAEQGSESVSVLVRFKMDYRRI